MDCMHKMQNADAVPQFFLGSFFLWPRTTSDDTQTWKPKTPNASFFVLFFFFFTITMSNSGTTSHRNDCGKTNMASSASSASSSIPTALTKQCLQLNFPNRRFTNEAVNLSSEFLKLVVVEARRRAAIEVRIIFRKYSIVFLSYFHDACLRINRRNARPRQKSMTTTTNTTSAAMTIINIKLVL